MKNLYILVLAFISLFAFQNCQPLTSMQIEVLKPAEINFPGNYNKIVFINLENDINNDDTIDTLLYGLITNEMSLGFLESMQNTMGVDSTRFLYAKGYPNKNRLYHLDTISWRYLEKLSGNSNADIFIVLDSLNLSMNNERFTDYYSYPVQYYKYRELAITANWSVFDIVDKKRLDRFQYNDTLYWEAVAYAESELDKKLPGIEQIIRETSYFTAIDYANRIFPGWEIQQRYFFQSGNKDFKKASELAKQGEWKEASNIWKQYVDDLDKEIASRAAFNLAVASELQGKFITAVGWAERSYEIKSKPRTNHYINLLKKRQKQLEKLQKQIY